MTGFTGVGFRQNLQNYKISDKNPPTRFELTGLPFGKIIDGKMMGRWTELSWRGR